MIAASLGALFIGGIIYFTGCGPAGGTAPFVQINSQDVNNNSNDNNSPNGSNQTHSLTVTNEDPNVRVSCEGPTMDGTWTGSCSDVYMQGSFSCPGETSLELCVGMCFVYGDVEACI